MDKSLRLGLWLFVAVSLGSAEAVRADEAADHTRSWGQEIYLEHCASCHGAGGGGDGPAAVALKTAPSDLTLIAKAHDGQFPRAFVTQFIDGRTTPAAHGSGEMPVWGNVFRQTDTGMGARARIYALTLWIESIQK